MAARLTFRMGSSAQSGLVLQDISSVKGDEFPELAAGSAAGRDGSHGKLGSGQSHADEHGSKPL